MQLDLQDSTHDSTAGSLLQAASDIAAVNPDAAVTVLDHSALQVGHMWHAVAACNDHILVQLLSGRLIRSVRWHSCMLLQDRPS